MPAVDATGVEPYTSISQNSAQKEAQSWKFNSDSEYQTIDDFSDVQFGAMDEISDGQVVSQNSYKDSRGLFDSVSSFDVIVAATCLGLLVVVSLCLLLWVRTRRRRQKLLHDLTFDDGTESHKSTKSAPSSRSPSPKLSKRSSYPDMKKASRGMMVRAITVEGVPDIRSPPERVQPRLSSSDSSGGDPNGSQPGDSSQAQDEEPSIADTGQGGRLWYSLLYDQTLELLNVTLVKVKDLPGRGNGQSRDPFVKMFLLPDERECRMSRVKKMTLNPVYNETCSFLVPSSCINDRAVRFSVYDVDKRRVRHCLGHVLVSLKDADLSNGEIKSTDLEPSIQVMSTLGDLQVSLLHLPATEKIRVGLHRAKGLSKMVKGSENMGAYVRIQLFNGHKCHRVKRTLAAAFGPEITFNESLSFTVHGRQFDTCNLVISLMLTYPRSAVGTGGSASLDLSSGNQTPTNQSSDMGREIEAEYGRIVIGPFMYARGDKLVHWQEMITNPKSVCTRWHALTSSSRVIASP